MQGGGAPAADTEHRCVRFLRCTPHRAQPTGSPHQVCGQIIASLRNAPVPLSTSPSPPALRPVKTHHVGVCTLFRACPPVKALSLCAGVCHAVQVPTAPVAAVSVLSREWMTNSSSPAWARQGPGVGPFGLRCSEGSPELVCAFLLGESCVYPDPGWACVHLLGAPHVSG